MSCKLLKRIAPNRGWSKVGVNIYRSQDWAVEADVVYSRTGDIRHPTITLKWLGQSLVVAAYMFSTADPVQHWSATMGSNIVGTCVPVTLPEGTAEAVFTIMVLGEMGEE